MASTFKFFLIFAEKWHATIPEHNKVVPIGGLNLKV